MIQPTGQHRTFSTDDQLEALSRALLQGQLRKSPRKEATRTTPSYWTVSPPSMDSPALTAWSISRGMMETTTLMEVSSTTSYRQAMGTIKFMATMVTIPSPD